MRWYGFQLASALDHVHSMGIIHRDVKSENAFVMRNDVVKLGDFGLACTLTPGAKSMTAGTVGTVYYMAPELLQGHRCAVPRNHHLISTDGAFCVAHFVALTLAQLFALSRLSSH